MEGGIEGEGGVTLGEQEAIPLRVVESGDFKDPAVERGEKVGDREAATDVADVRKLGMLDYAPTNVGAHPPKACHPASLVGFGTNAEGRQNRSWKRIVYATDTFRLGTIVSLRPPERVSAAK